MSRWRGRLPGRLPRRFAARCWWSRSDAQTEAALPRMPVSASWVPRRNAVLGAQLKACARNRAAGRSRSSIFGARPVSRQVGQPIAQRPGAMCCDRRNGLARPQLPRMLVQSCRTGAGQNEVAIGGDVDVAAMRAGVDDTDPKICVRSCPGDRAPRPVMPVQQMTRRTAAVRSAAGMDGWSTPPERGASREPRAASGHHDRRPFASSYGRLTDVAFGNPRSPRLPSRRRRLRLAERRRWRGPMPRDARSSG
jgi:hypothetical protein